MRPLHRLLSAGAATALTTAALALPGTAFAATAPPAPATLPGSTPSWATPNDVVGETPSGTGLDVTIDLGLQDPQGALAYADAVSNPATPYFGRYLSPQAFKARFARPDAIYAMVTKVITDHGVQVTETSPVNTYLVVHLTAGQAEQLFGTDLLEYRHDGKVLRAPSRQLTLPGGLAGFVTNVGGLTESLAHPAGTTGADAPPSPGYANAGPCSTYYGQVPATGTPAVDGAVQPYVPCGYTPAQVRSAYGLTNVPATGAGVTVGIVDAYASPTIAADAATYAARHGVPALVPGQYRQIVPASYAYGYGDTVHGDQCGEQGWYGEQTLDVEAVHGVAPGANILYSGASSCQDSDINLAVRRILDTHAADMISNSYGDTGENLPASDIAGEHLTLAQAAIEGIGIYFSSGDNGDEVVHSGARTADYPASDTLVTAVGGTSIAIGADGSRTWETGWSTGRSTLTNGAWSPTPPGSYVYGGGGGTSKLFPQPAYQRGVVPPSISGYFGGNGRAVPDVSAIGDPNTGFLVGQTQTFATGVRYDEYRIGGTSLASPVFAATMAIADQVAGRHHGFANYQLYALTGSSALYDESSSALHYVVRNDYKNGEDASAGITTSLRSINLPATIKVRPGYDDVTGIGSPIGPGFIAALE